eukprot:scaffold202536_cov93-Cyclotella_meneghiniana.AAC.1
MTIYPTAYIHILDGSLDFLSSTFNLLLLKRPVTLRYDLLTPIHHRNIKMMADGSMHAAWRDSNLIDLSELLLLTQIRPAFMFASAGYIKHPKNDKELVTIAIDKRLIMQMGLFTEQYKMWRCKPPNFGRSSNLFTYTKMLDFIQITTQYD